MRLFKSFTSIKLYDLLQLLTNWEVKGETFIINLFAVFFWYVFCLVWIKRRRIQLIWKIIH